MPYKVYKTQDDNRNHTHGFVIPNGGWYHIVEMTFENYKQLSNVSQMPGHSVDYVESNVLGMFDPEGNQVDPMTVEVHRATKQVVNYETINKKRAGKETPVKANVKEGERDEVIAECLRKGLRIDQRWSTQKIKEALANANRPAQSTLAVQ